MEFSNVFLYTIVTISSIFLATLRPVASTELDHNLDSIERKEIFREILKFSFQAGTLIRITYNLYNEAISGNKAPQLNEKVQFQYANSNNNITNEELENIVGEMLPSLDRYIKEFEIIEKLELHILCKVPLEHHMKCYYPESCNDHGSIDVPYCCLKTTIKKLKEIKMFLSMLFGRLRKDVNHKLKNNIIPFSLQEQEEFTMTILRKTSTQLDHIQKTLRKL